MNQRASASGPTLPEMNRPVMPPAIAPPAANYAHAVVTERAGRWLHTSGVVPVAPAVTVPQTAIPAAA